MSVRGYVITSAANDSLVAELFAGNPAPGSPIIGHILDQLPSGNTNQQWRVDPVPAGVDLYTIRNVAAATYAGFSGTPGPVRFSPIPILLSQSYSRAQPLVGMTSALFGSS
jgi:hypothetical protein